MDWLITPDGRTFIQIFLPTIWVFVSLLAALALYKTSKAPLQALNFPASQIPAIQLGGSAVIFIIVFLLLRFSTVTAPGTNIPAADLSALRTASQRVETRTAELHQCSQALEGTQGCEISIEQLRSEASELRQVVDRIDPQKP
ncbi:MAG TPA: hypothetical protein VEZ41_02615 [Allosphingosinicella sp.]|nr:hypothetical protein [Allosphingosinicella sp.]